MSPLSTKVISHDGCRLQVHRWGSDGPACIFLHGFGEGGYIWDDFAPTVVPQYWSIVIDLRGHGDSDWDPSRQYNADCYIRDVHFLIDELGLKRVAIVGHSLGGSIALRVAAARPAEVFALVLVDSGPELRQDGVARIRSDFRESHRVYPTVGDYVAWLEQRRVLLRRETLQRFAFRSLRTRPDRGFDLKADRWILNQRSEAADELWKVIAEVSCPALVLRGVASSVLAREAAIKTMRAFRRAQLLTIDRAGHGLIAENPEAFSDAAHRFLNEAVNEHVAA